MNRSQRRMHSLRRPAPVRDIPVGGILAAASLTDRAGRVRFTVPGPGFEARFELPRRPQGWVVQLAGSGFSTAALPAHGTVEVTPEPGRTAADGLLAACRWLSRMPETRGLPVSIAATGRAVPEALAAASRLGPELDAVLLDDLPAGEPVTLTPVLVATEAAGSDLSAFLDLPTARPRPALNHEQRRRLARGLARGLRRARRKDGRLSTGAKAVIAALAAAIAFTFSAGIGVASAEAAITGHYTSMTGQLTVTGDGSAQEIALDCTGGPSSPALLTENGVPLGLVTLVGGGPPTAAIPNCNAILGVTVNAGGGNDTIDFTAVNNTTFPNMGLHGTSLDGQANGDQILGPDLTVGATLSGGLQADTVTGGSGPDLLAGDAGFNDSLIGGGGSDTVDYSASAGNRVINLPAGTSTSGSETDTLSAIENATGSTGHDSIIAGNALGTFRGSAGNDTITGSLAGPSTLIGGDGNDSLTAMTAGQSHSLQGEGGNDTLTGQGQADTLDGGADNDSLSGAGGADTLLGGIGDDTLVGGAGVDSLSGQDGDDRLVSDAASGETLHGGAGSDTADFTPAPAGVVANISTSPSGGMTFNSLENVRGSAFGDTLTGTNGNNLMEGGGGADSITGGAAGNDTLIGDAGNDVLSVTGGGQKLLQGGADNDILSGSSTALAGTANTLEGGTGNDTLSVGGSMNNSLTGGDGGDLFNLGSAAGDNTVSGGPGADTINSGPGNDSLLGDAGIDSITGGDGNDTINGGADNDTMLGGVGTDSLTGAGGVDEIRQSGVSADQVLTDGLVYGQGPDTLATVERASLAGGSSLLDAGGFTVSQGVTLAGTGVNNQTLVGSPAADSLAGGGGTGDQLRSSANANQILTPASLTSGAFTDTLAGFASASLTGGLGPNLIDAVAFNGPVTLDGGVGDDTLAVGTGGYDDSLIAGTGTDGLLVPGISPDSEVTISPTLLSGNSAFGVGDDTLSGFDGLLEGASITGDAFDELIDAGAFTGLVSLNGAAGNDTLIAPSGTGRDHTLAGGAGASDRVVRQSSQSQTITDTEITGLLDTVVLSGVEGVTITAGTNNDSLSATGFTLGPVALDGVGGGDTLAVRGDFSDTLIGGTGPDLLLPGTIGALNGGSVDGGAGADSLAFTADVHMGLTGSSLGAGAGFVHAVGLEQASLTGGASANSLDAASFPGSVSLSGLDGADTLVPGSGSSTLSGGQGNDRITAGPLADALQGDAGTDTLLSAFDADQVLTNVSLTGSGGDQASGFESASLTGGPAANLLDSSQFLGPANLSGQGGDDTLKVNPLYDGQIVGGPGTDRVVQESITGDATLTGTALNSASSNKSIDEIETASLTGNASANTFNTPGFNGPVTLAGGDGNDTLRTSGVNGHSDSIDGGPGTDAVSPATATGLSIQLTDTQLTGAPGLGNDSLAGIERASIEGDASGQLIDAGAFSGLVSLNGGPGSDTLVAAAGAGDQTLLGGAGVDRAVRSAPVSQTINGDSITGGGTVHLSLIDQISVSGGPGPDLLDASDHLGPVSLAGGGGADTLLGNNQQNLLEGGPGDDVLSPRIASTDNSNDTLIGGPGTDSLDFIGNDIAPDTLTLANSQVHYLPGGFIKQLDSIERARLTGGGGNNQYDASAFTGPVSILGAGSHDTLTGGTAADTIDAGPGTDRVAGGPGNDSLEGGPGADTLVQSGDSDHTLHSDGVTSGQGIDSTGGFEAASVTGGASGNRLDATEYPVPVSLDGAGGNDTLIGTAQSDRLEGGPGTDRVEQQTDADQILTDIDLSGRGDDTLSSIEQASLTGGPSANLIDASGLTDTLPPFTGQTTLSGHGGPDTLLGGAGHDQIHHEGESALTLTDTELTGAVTDQFDGIESARLGGTAGNDSLDASAFTIGPVELTGGDGSDTLLAGQAGSTLDGGSGADSLLGGAGIDQLSGGAGDDQLDSRDNETSIDANDCGADSDEALTDPGDTHINCELVNGEEVGPTGPTGPTTPTGPTGPTTPTGPTGPSEVAPKLTLSGPVKQRATGRRVPIKLFARCDRGCSVRVTGRVHYRQRVKRKGKAKLLKRTLPIPARSVTLTAGKRQAVHLRLTVKNSRRLKGLAGRRNIRNLTAKLRAVATGPEGKWSAPATRTIRILPAKKKRRPR